MNLSGNTILITGGATGIGLELATRFEKLGNKVVICSRRKERLEAVHELYPEITGIQCDISNFDDLGNLYDHIMLDFPELNVLINNAGIQRAIDLKKGIEGVAQSSDEIDINFSSQIRVTETFISLILKQKEAAIVNVTSGLGFIPLARFPIYSATKAAMHSFTLSLRHQLKDTNVRVFELIPPTVHDTELKGKPIEKTDYSISAKEVGEHFVDAFEVDNLEVAPGPAGSWLALFSRPEVNQIFNGMNHQ